MNEHPGIATIRQAVLERGAAGDYRDLGDIYTKHMGELILFTYSPVAAYTRRWNPVERVSRGLIMNATTGEVVARPFDKFFNLGEMEETKEENLPALPYEVLNKEDGSLGILYRYNGEYRIATRGAFTSAQALWATERLRQHALDASIEGLTLLFEIVYPSNRIVLDYGDFEGLILIGARSIATGEDLSHDELMALGARFGFPVVARISQELAECLAERSTMMDCEGWVLRYANGLRVKIKTEEYLRLHRLVTGLNPRRVHEVLLLGGEHWATFVAALPDEFRVQVEAWAEQINAAVMEKLERVAQAFGQVRAAVGEGADRGTFARCAIGTYPDLRGYLFAMLDGKEVYPLILKQIDAMEVCGVLDAAVTEE